MNTVVWIHGYPLSSALFERQLSIDGVRHIAPDLPGFGHAPAPTRELTMDDYAQFILDTLDQFRVERAVFAGVSMGGYIAFAALRKAPERFDGLILLDTRETADTPEARQGRFDTIAKVEQQGVEPVVTAMLPKMLTANASPQDVEFVRTMMASSKPEGVIAALRAMANREDSSALLPTIQVPTLIVVGSEDSVTPEADARRMASAIPGAQLVVIPQAAHLANIERADLVNDAIARFVLQRNQR